MVVEKEQVHDLIIIGGGIIGLMSAFFVKRKQPDWKVAIIDKNLVGYGTTSYSAFLDMPYGTTEYKRYLTTNSRALFEEIVYKAINNYPVTYKKFIGCCSDENLTNVKSNISDRNLADCSYEQLPDLPDFILNKSFNYIGNLTGTYTNVEAVNYIRKKLIEWGVKIYENIEVRAVKEVQHGIYRLESDIIGPFLSKRIIESAGPYMSQKPLLENAHAINGRLKKVIAFHVDVPPEKNDPIVYFFDDDAFLMPQVEEKKWIFSYRCLDWDIEINNNSLKVTQQNYHDASNVLKKYTKDLASKIFGARVFCDLYSENGDPIIETLQENYIRVGAGGGSGYRLSTGIAQEIMNKLNI